MSPTILVALLGVFSLGAVAPRVYAQNAPPERELDIRPFRGQVYEVRDGIEHTVFVVTSDGIVLVDPLSRPAATALKAYLDEHFPDAPVRYVVLTHHHPDRAEGAGVFGEAQLVAHRAYPAELTRSRQLRRADYRFVREVRDTFNRTRTIRLGDTSVQLAHVRSTHAADMTVVFFTTERVLFAVAPPPVTAVPFSFDGVAPGEVFGWIDAVAPLAPEVLLFDDGMQMAGAAFDELAQYLQSIRREIGAAYERGRTLTQIQAGEPNGATTSATHAAVRSDHLAAVYNSLRLVRVELAGRAIATYTSRNPASVCGGTLTVCSAGGAVLGGAGGLAVTVGRRAGMVVEGTFGEQFWSAGAGPGHQQETALRLSRYALLFRYGAPRPDRFSIMPVVGVSSTTGDVRGLSHVTGVLTPVGGYHLIAGRTTRMGLTAGADLVKSAGRRFSISAPVRLTRMSGDRPDHWHAMTDVQAGIGISVPIIRRVGMR